MSNVKTEALEDYNPFGDPLASSKLYLLFISKFSKRIFLAIYCKYVFLFI